MKRSLWLLVSAAVLMMATAAVAGEQCEADTQTCLNYLAQKASKHGWIGVDVEPDKETGGFMLTGVKSGSPAEKAGFMAGQLVVAIDGEKVDCNDPASVQGIMAKMVPGADFTFTVASHGKKKDIAITLQQMPEEEVAAMVGKHLLDHAQVADASGSD